MERRHPGPPEREAREQPYQAEVEQIPKLSVLRTLADKMSALPQLPVPTSFLLS